ncbi:MAG: hypothetical protein M1836_001421 [Candelina mexicana]|nr:MAG: hypothetical protein M1836_001421 [Candelina mexicana]
MDGSPQKRPLRGHDETEHTAKDTPYHYAHGVARQEHTAADEGPFPVSRGSSSTADNVAKPGFWVRKIAESASGLSKGFLIASAAHEVSSATTSEQSSSSKGPLLTGSSESAGWAQHSGPSRSSDAPSNPLEPTQSFRSTSDKGSGEQEFSQYLSEARSPLFGLGESLQVSSPGVGDLPAAGTEKTCLQTSKATCTQSPHQSSHLAPSSFTSSRAQYIDPGDGAEVVALLSDPNLSIEGTPPSFFPIAEDQVNTDNLFRLGTSQWELEAKEALGTKLPAAPNHNTPSPSNPLNLIPNRNWYETELLVSPSNGDKGKENYATHLQPDTTIKEYYSAWAGVLSRYTDEVWGDLLPLVEEARADINQTLEEEHILEPKAAARLEMILRHLRGRTLP